MKLSIKIVRPIKQQSTKYLVKQCSNVFTRSRVTINWAQLFKALLA